MCQVVIFLDNVKIKMTAQKFKINMPSRKFSFRTRFKQNFKYFLKAMLCVTRNFYFILGMESHHRFVSVNIFIYMLYFKRSFAHNVVLKTVLHYF